MTRDRPTLQTRRFVPGGLALGAPLLLFSRAAAAVVLDAPPAIDTRLRRMAFGGVFGCRRGSWSSERGPGRRGATATLGAGIF